MTTPHPADTPHVPSQPREGGVARAGAEAGRKPRVLVVEDEVIVARDLEMQLEDLGFAPVGHAMRGEEAVELAEKLRPDLVLMDVQLAGAMNGIAAAEIIRTRLAVPVVFLSANHPGAAASEAAGEGSGFTIAKPFDEQTLQVVVRRALGES